MKRKRPYPAHRPWERSTGPRTAEGKARVSGNSRVHGLCSRDWQELQRYLKSLRRLLDELEG